jgi:hypothetical protein
VAGDNFWDDFNPLILTQRAKVTTQKIAHNSETVRNSRRVTETGIVGLGQAVAAAQCTLTLTYIFKVKRNSDHAECGGVYNLDSVFSVFVVYVQNEKITFSALASEPPAESSGRFYGDRGRGGGSPDTDILTLPFILFPLGGAEQKIFEPNFIENGWG